MVKPNFMIVGVARCGTTSLFEYISNHPEIGMPKLKEPKYFSSIDLDLPQNGIADNTVFTRMIIERKNYYNLFDRFKGFKAIGEASSDYFYYYKNVIPRIKKELGDIKIIICLRNPIERSFSAYCNLLRDSREKLSFSDALAHEQQRIDSNWDWMWHYKNGSIYFPAVKMFIEKFSKVKIILFDDLTSNPKKICSEVFEFLEVDKKYSPKEFPKYSFSGKPKNNLFSLLTTRNNKYIFFIREVLLKFFPRKIIDNFSQILFSKEKIKNQDSIKLSLFFKNDIYKLGNFIKRDLSKWI